jgi:hypothetical protein
MFGEKACHPEPMRGVDPERSEWAQGKLREGSGSTGAEILSEAKDDSLDPSPVRFREALSPNSSMGACNVRKETIWFN